MHRSFRTSLISGETSFSSTSTSSFRGSSSDEIEQHLPTYNPRSHAAKKELSRLRSAQNAIHFIPLVLLLCAVILWFFSNQGLIFVISR
ncbi:hypothetical protein UlMin_001558 [Ulmus minor]